VVIPPALQKRSEATHQAAAGLARQLHSRRNASMDRTSQEEIKAHLMQTSEPFRDLQRQVEALEAKHALTPEEELEEHRLKKLKLHLKDEMEQMVNEYQLQHAAS
jgi:uncharacterized protein YdcH (DUF465 family)